MRSTVVAALGVSISLALASPARATPAPHSVVVVANADVPESVSLAIRYAAERDLPPSQICLLSLPVTEDLALADFQAMLDVPLRACIARTEGLAERLEAILLVRGVPLRVSMDIGGTTRRASLAAALGLWDTSDASGAPILGRDPGTDVPCGGRSCWGAAWRNQYHGEPFEASFEREVAGIVHRPVLVTMLHGRTYGDAGLLLTSALQADRMSDGAMGEFLLMQGADAARGALDREYASVLAALTARGFTASEVPFDSNLTGRTLAGFVTGTASLAETIEGNSFHPGALVDNLTSFGAVPVNFRDMGEQQVSIARWVARGVAGAHGTTDEPLNNCFPSRAFLMNYVDGATLGEAFIGQLPFVYWHNLVLGDPLTAPYARRPDVMLEGLAGDDVSGAQTITVRAIAASDRVVDELLLFVDGAQVGRADGDLLEYCLPPSGDAPVHLLAVARTPYDFDAERSWEARGWIARTVTVREGASSCGGGDAGAALDGGAGSADAGARADGGVATETGGCTCRAGARGGARAPVGLALVIALGLCRRRRARA